MTGSALQRWELRIHIVFTKGRGLGRVVAGLGRVGRWRIFFEALNTAQAFGLEKGRLQNTAPVHESGLRKCLDFVFGLGVDLGCFLSPFGLPLEALGETLGRPWGDLGDSLGCFWRLWQPWGALGCLWAPFWQTLSSLCGFRLES